MQALKFDLILYVICTCHGIFVLDTFCPQNLNME